MEETCGGGAGSEGSEVVTDVIQQLLELSEQVAGESSQPQPQEQAIIMETAINQDILQASVAQQYTHTHTHVYPCSQKASQRVAHTWSG